MTKPKHKQLELFDDERKLEREKQISKLKKVLNYDTRDYPIEFIVSLYKDDSRIFAPDYQREESLWSVRQKSRFIESLILGYPIPLIFLADTAEGELEIIDGLQRISTLTEFINNDFELEDLKKLSKLNGCFFEDLPRSEMNRFGTKSLRIIVLKDTTPDDVRKDLFDRLNTSSLQANPSEIRWGRESNNHLMQLIRKLQKNDIFKRTVNLSENLLNRKEDIELISRFFAYSNTLNEYKGSVINFLDAYISNEGISWTDEKQELFEKEFIRTMEFVDSHFPRGFQKENRNQTPRVRFEAIAVGVNLALRENPGLKASPDIINTLLKSKQFEEWTTTDAANNRNKVTARINGVKNFLLTNKFEEIK